jgi:hypothetical protein
MQIVDCFQDEKLPCSIEILFQAQTRKFLVLFSPLNRDWNPSPQKPRASGTLTTQPSTSPLEWLILVMLNNCHVYKFPELEFQRPLCSEFNFIKHFTAYPDHKLTILHCPYAYCAQILIIKHFFSY